MALFGSVGSSLANTSSFKNDIESLWSKKDFLVQKNFSFSLFYNLLFLAKIMSPIKKEIDPNLVGQFCQKLSQDLDEAQKAIDLITGRMQSRQEWEAIIALYVVIETYQMKSHG
jgi:hypothetical protein